MSRSARFHLEDIARLYRDGASPQAISAELGCCVSTAQRLAKKACEEYGIPFRGVIGNPSRLDAQAVMLMRAQGMTQSEVARRLGTSQKAVASFERRMRDATPRAQADGGRDEAGTEPLPAGHPITWGAISADAWGVAAAP